MALAATLGLQRLRGRGALAAALGSQCLRGGQSYERWKKTPEYQQWLKESGQVESREIKTSWDGHNNCISNHTKHAGETDHPIEALMKLQQHDSAKKR